SLANPPQNATLAPGQTVCSGGPLPSPPTGTPTPTLAGSPTPTVGPGPHFNPTFSLTASTDQADAPVEITADFGIPEPDVNFARVIAYVPPEFQLPNSGQLPIGVKRVNLDSVVRLGL